MFFASLVIPLPTLEPIPRIQPVHSLKDFLEFTAGGQAEGDRGAGEGHGGSGQGGRAGKQEGGAGEQEERKGGRGTGGQEHRESAHSHKEKAWRDQCGDDLDLGKAPRLRLLGPSF